MKPIYTKEEEGCYGDGSLGHSHVREKLAHLIFPFNAGLSDLLREDPSDDMSEEDEALEILGEHSAPGMVWEFHDGDLILRYDPEQDPDILTYEHFPEWAVPAMEYGEGGLLPGDRNKGFTEWADREFKGKSFFYTIKEDEDAAFSRSPEFGPASNCVTLYVRIMEPAEPVKDLFTEQA